MSASWTDHVQPRERWGSHWLVHAGLQVWLGLWEDAGEDGGEDLAASPATHQLHPAFRIGMMSGGDQMKEPTFGIPVLGIQHGHMLSEFQRT